MSYYSNKRILVAGGNGLVGINLIKKLLDQGAIITSTVYKNKLRFKDKRVKYIECDLTRMKDCMNITRDIDYVFLVAANSSGAETIEQRPLSHLTPNILINSQMLEASYVNKIEKFCFISSNTVYPLTDFPVKENDVNYDFFEKYYIVGWMKLFSEKMCDMYNTKISNTMKTLVVRPGNLYGPYDKFKWSESKVVAALIRKGIEKKVPFEVWGDGNDIKDFLYIDDFIEGMLVAFEQKAISNPINIASGERTTINDVVDAICDVLSIKKSTIVYKSDKPTMIPRRLINIDKIKKETQWRPKISIEEGISKTIDWYKNYYKDFKPENENAYL